MSVLIFIDQAEGHVKKASLEALSYGSRVAEQMGTSAEGVILGTLNEDIAALGKYGVKKIHHVADERLNQFDAQVFTKVLAQAVDSTRAKLVIFSNNIDGKAIAPRLAARSAGSTRSGRPCWASSAPSRRSTTR